MNKTRIKPPTEDINAPEGAMIRKSAQYYKLDSMLKLFVWQYGEWQRSFNLTLEEFQKVMRRQKGNFHVDP